MRHLACLLVLFLVGCSSKPALPPTTPQAFTWGTQAVEFSPPPPEWKQRPITTDHNKPVGVVFDNPSGHGQLAVAVTDGIKELDKATLQRLADDVSGHRGKILKQDYLNVAGGKENAYHMEDEIEGDRGQQAHFVLDNRLYSVMFIVPAKDYDLASAAFERVLQTFKVKGK